MFALTPIGRDSTMKWLDNLQHKETGMRSIAGSQRLQACSYENVKTIGNYDGEQVEYELSVEIATFFRGPSTTDQRSTRKDHEILNDRIKQAKINLSKIIYEDVFISIGQIREALTCGDIENALRDLNDLDKKLTH